MTAKIAADELGAALEPPDNLYRAQVAKNILVASLGAAGVGAAIRGVRGLADTAEGAMGTPPRVPLRQQFIRMPVPRRRPEEKVADGAGPLVAAAALCKHSEVAPPATTAAAPPAPDAWTRAGGKALQLLGGLRKPGETFGPARGLLYNPDATNVSEMPWAMIGAPLAVAGAAYAGHKATDYLLDKSKSREQESELDAARQRYEQALGGAAAGGKAAGHDGLDRAYDLLEKRAGGLRNLVAQLAGPYGLAATTIGVGAGIGAYNWTKGRSEERSAEEALRRRRVQLFQQQPTPVLALTGDPEPTPSGFASLRRRFRGGDPDEKAANLAAAADATLGKFDARKRQIMQQTAVMMGQAKPPAPPKAPAGKPAPPVLPSVVNR